jgi:hypothetical protein
MTHAPARSSSSSSPSWLLQHSDEHESAWELPTLLVLETEEMDEREEDLACPVLPFGFSFPSFSSFSTFSLISEEAGRAEGGGGGRALVGGGIGGGIRLRKRSPVVELEER